MRRKLKFIFICGFILINFKSKSQENPNILWIVCEDQSMFFSPYGDSTAKTPNIDELASKGIVYDNFHAVSPVCAPSRSSIITGMYPTTIGTHNMRAYKNRGDSINHHTNLPIYSGVAKRKVQFFTEILRAKGYYCSNNSKEDYNMEMSPLAWDESNKNAHWKNRKENQPFFSVFNFNICHESKIWKNHKQHNLEEINKIILPPFFPKNDIIKNDFVTNYKNIEKLDEQIGELINQLKNDGLYEKTIIFFYSDHGGPFPRFKRSIYDTGLKCPLIIKWDEKTRGTRNNQMISFIDLAPTIIELSGGQAPSNMEGVSFYNSDNRDYIFAATDRFDEFTDRRRCIRSKNFKLIFNYDTISSIMQPVSYRKNMKTMNVLDSLNNINELSNTLKNWYKKSKSKFELYDVQNDPYELSNLYGKKDYENIFDELNKKLSKWINSSDYGNMSEVEMLKEMWPKGIKPILNEPYITETKNGTIINSNNLNSSVGWRNIKSGKWEIYEENEIINSTNNFEVIVFKPGYGSKIKTFN